MNQLPVPGEEGWQVLAGIAGWIDIEITDGPFYSNEQYETCTCTFFDPQATPTDSSYPIYRLRAPQKPSIVGWCPYARMRRKPEQKDNKAAEVSFEKLLSDCGFTEVETDKGPVAWPSRVDELKNAREGDVSTSVDPHKTHEVAVLPAAHASNQLQGREVASRLAHNQEVAGSNPALATNFYLPTKADRVYRVPALAKSSAGVRSPFKPSGQQGAPERRAFFCAHSFMVGVVEALRGAVPRYGTSNSITPATNELEVGRGGSQPTEDSHHAAHGAAAFAAISGFTAVRSDDRIVSSHRNPSNRIPTTQGRRAHSEDHHGGAFA